MKKNLLIVFLFQSFIVSAQEDSVKSNSQYPIQYNNNDFQFSIGIPTSFIFKNIYDFYPFDMGSTTDIRISVKYKPEFADFLADSIEAILK